MMNNIFLNYFLQLHKISIDKIYLTLYNGSTGSVIHTIRDEEKEYMRAGSLYLDSLDSLPLTAVVLIVLNRLDGRNGLTARRVYSESLRQIV